MKKQFEYFLVCDRGQPHLSRMTPIRHLTRELRRYTDAIARWDDEGGATNATFGDTSYRRVKSHSEPPAPLALEQNLTVEEKILECLGAAVTLRWGTLPTKTQRDLFEQATSISQNLDMNFKSQVARFLHRNADGEAIPAFYNQMAERAENP